MRQAVRDVFYDFNSPYEGEVPFMYQDVRGLVSIGVGMLVDPIQLAMNLPLVHPDGTPATRNDIAAEWAKIKSLGTGPIPGNPAALGGHLYAKPHTRLRLTKEGLRLVLEAKLNQMETHLKGRFPEWDTFPADAQLAILSMSWACGPAFRFPLLEARIRAQNWAASVGECHMDEHNNPGLKPRNKANKILFANADWVKRFGLDPELLIWPKDAWSEKVGNDDITLQEFATVHPIVPLGREPPDDDAA